MEVFADVEIKIGEHCVLIRASGREILIHFPSLPAARQVHSALRVFDLNRWIQTLDRAGIVARILIGAVEAGQMGSGARPTLARHVLGLPPIHLNWVGILKIWLASKKD
jgi:hypothetical protein